jgi:hypothetical protein
MIAWLIHSSAERIDTDVSACEKELDRLMSSKIAPLEDDFVFDTIYKLGDHRHMSKPFVIITGESGACRSSIFSLITGFAEEVEVSPYFLMAEGMSQTVPGTIRGDNSKLSFIRRIYQRDNPVLDRISFCNLPVGFEESPLLLVEANMIVVAISSTSPDFSPKFKRFLSGIRNWNEKVRFVFQGPDFTPQMIGPVVWALCRCVHAAEMPRSYFIDLGDSERTSLFADLLALPTELSFNRLELTMRQAKLARAHAILMAHIKSQLPTIYRQSKQDKIAEELESVIQTVSAKSGININEFPSAEYLRDKIRAFDFGRLKKMKETNLEMINEFIEKDYGRLRSMFPADKIQIFQKQVFCPKNLQDLSKFPKPNVAEFVEAFESLNPTQGIVNGSALKDHLISISHLPSQSLHRIWKLADLDKDGGLTLKEYTICRILIRLVQAGEDIPKQLPPSYLEF